MGRRQGKASEAEKLGEVPPPLDLGEIAVKPPEK
jgi:hypothetical protein